MIEFKMPSLGADMEAGTLVAWQKQPGEAVHRGDIVAEVETDKGIIEIESFSDGVLDRYLAPVGVKVPVGTVLALFREDGVVAATAPPELSQPSAITAPTASSPPPRAQPAPSAEHATERLPMSPSARRLARELGVDPTHIHGTGKGGAITREDVQHAAEVAHGAAPETPPPTSPAPAEAAPADRFARMRQTIAAAMSRSKREIPHYYLSTTIDMHPALTWLEAENLKRPMTERLLPGVLLLKATALALHEVPELNATWEGGQVVLKSQIHVGMAISMRQGGLIAPAIHDTDQKSLDQLMADLRDLIARARAGGLRSSELSDPTITVTSMGDQGVEAVFGVIYPPQVAIVGFGKVVERPWSINGGLMSRRVVTATLSADHRVSDGHRGGLFLSAIDRLLQEPERL
ncbi:MAG TPA: dihydrolipoamide acetyltransferase family protein [Planctomycetaceae bacterium]|nr:dihydrolipoamide acetyltransferase family protein [Planctomycetaceae bacterium]